VQRPDDVSERRKKLAHLSSEELRQRFWDLTGKVVDPLVELARTHTSPSIERSVLLRMGFSSLESKAIVEKVSELGLLGKGAGHVVLKTAKALGLEYREAGRAMAAGRHWETVEELFPRQTRPVTVASRSGAPVGGEAR
jgi:D-ornithine 4,5-aminomutase subunit alpha